MDEATRAWSDSLVKSLEEASRDLVTEVLDAHDYESICQSVRDFERKGKLKEFEGLAESVVMVSSFSEARVRELCPAIHLSRYLSGQEDASAGSNSTFAAHLREAVQLLTHIDDGVHLDDAVSSLGRRTIDEAATTYDDALQDTRRRIRFRAAELAEGPRWGLRYRYGARDEDAWQIQHHLDQVKRELTRRVLAHLLDESMRMLSDNTRGVQVMGHGIGLNGADKAFRLGDSTIRIHHGSITESRAHIVVSSDDNLLTMGGGVSQAIQLAAGIEIVRDAAKLTPRVVGDVVVTTAGQMPNRYVAHAVTMRAYGSPIDLPRGLLVRQLCKKVMSLLAQLDCRSVAFPAIGAGLAGIPYAEVAAEMGDAILDAVILSEKPVDVELYLTDRFGGDGVASFLEAFETIARERFGLDAHEAIDNSGLVDLTLFMDKSTSGWDAQLDARAAQVVETLRDLDVQRRSIESLLLAESTASAPVDQRVLEGLRLRLDALAEMRGIYASELRGTPTAPSVDKDSVFVSSTSRDLQEHRSVVRSVVNRLNLKFVGMEDFEANPLAPADLIRQKVMESNVYLGILGMRYGYVDDASGLSMTELEYRQAVAGNKDIRMFVMDEDAPVKASMVERDPRQLELLNDFRDRVLKSHACNLFETTNDLAVKVEKTLSSLR